MQQNTNDWLLWRKQGIGASEAAAVLGLCPYQTPYTVWLDKTGRAKAFEGNIATQRGQELEAKARSLYELISLEDMPPAIAVHPKYEIMRASLDGLRADGKLILEIKCPGEANHALAQAGKLPGHYEIQVQQQLAVTGADLCHYFSYYDKDESHALIEVTPDVAAQAVIIIKILEFWEKYVVTNTPPPLTDRDVKIINDNAEIISLCKIINENAKDMQKEKLDVIKARIIQLGGHPKISCGNIQISSVSRNGKFSFNKLTIKAEQSA